MSTNDEESYKGYLENELSRFESRQDKGLGLLEYVSEFENPAVLDLGCGAGQELLHFSSRKGVLKIGVDVKFAAGGIFNHLHSRRDGEKSIFINSAGEELPFAKESFNLIICRVALPYMHSETAIREMSRILAPDGRIVLTVHAPGFYLQMIQKRLGSFSVRQLAYPVVCFAGGLWFLLTAKQPRGAFWKGKETFHTKSMLARELNACGLRIIEHGPAEGKGGHTYLIGKH